ncbi:MAG: VIT1/CCC1 transporter family protein [Parcubacteria group bacterium]|nr:VIT1/CCC1 transporter family protein [Parcubacteria group bacterium]
MAEENFWHRKGERYIKDIVYAANDGIVTSFAIVAASAAAGFSAFVVLLLGLANLFADGFSMAAGNYLGTRSEEATYRKERKMEESEIASTPVLEQAEIEEILRKKGFRGEELSQMASLIVKNPKFWVDLMMTEELRLGEPEVGGSVKNAGLTFLSFVSAGVIPLFPFIFFRTSVTLFEISLISTGLALFLVGALRTSFTGRKWFFEGLEMLVVGGIAASIAYFIGLIIQKLI